VIKTLISRQYSGAFLLSLRIRCCDKLSRACLPLPSSTYWLSLSRALTASRGRLGIQLRDLTLNRHNYLKRSQPPSEAIRSNLNKSVMAKGNFRRLPRETSPKTLKRNEFRDCIGWPKICEFSAIDVTAHTKSDRS
jgi:hypothetical protein